MSLNSTSQGVCLYLVCLYHTHLPCSPLISANSFPQAESCWDKQEQTGGLRGALSQHSTGKRSSGLYFHASHALPMSAHTARACHGSTAQQTPAIAATKESYALQERPRIEVAWGISGAIWAPALFEKPQREFSQFVTLKHKPDHAKRWAKGINLLLQRFMARQTSLTLITYIDVLLRKSIVP